MSDLIDRQAAIDEIKKDIMGGLNYELFLRRLPAIDAEPVIRCKDCDWWDRIDDGPYGYCHACKHGFYSANWEISIYRRYKEDFFCADGERRSQHDLHGAKAGSR